MLPLTKLFLILNIVNISIQRRNGAPESVCDTMLPFHGDIPPQPLSSSLFSIHPITNTIGQGQILRVEVESTIPNLSFQGFMISARTVSPPFRIVGRFASSADGTIKLINCGGTENTATHSNTNLKAEFGLDWQAPTDYIGDVIFNATIAQEYDKFWVGIESSLVQIVPKDQVSQIAKISTTRRPIASTTQSIYRTTKQIEVSQEDPFYMGCGETKTCFGLPNNCVSSKSCQTLLAVIVRGERYIFEMKSRKGAAYVAVALSDDNIMGKDSVIECVYEGGSIKSFTSWTTSGPGNYGSPRQGIQQSSIQMLEKSYVDGQIYCQVERNSNTIVNGQRFDLINDKHFLLLATGDSLDSNSVGYHGAEKLASSEALKLSDISMIAARSKILLRLHGAFMIVAWIGTASVGILLARYFKQTWVGHSGTACWFVWHRVCMVATWLLTMAAFVMIFIELNGWSSVLNPHAVLGTITTTLCFIQPIGAFFRPHPGTKNRPFFNLIHWLLGNAAHILAIVTIFFAVKLVKAELPEWLDFILVAFVVFHVLMHFIFSISGCASDRKEGQRVTSFPMADMNASRGQMMTQSLKQDSAFSGFRKVLLGVYLLFIILFVIVFVVIAVLAPINPVEALKSKINN